MNQEIVRAMETLRRNEGAVDEALSLLQKTVYGFSMRLCGHREDAEDTMQEVLMHLLPYLRKIEDPRAMSVWLYKTARSRCLMKHRGQQTSRLASLDELLPGEAELSELLAHKGPTPEDEALAGQQSERLQEAVRRLPPIERMTLTLYDMEELTTAEVAQAMEMSEGAVRVRLHRARLQLRRLLSGSAETGRRRKVSPDCRRIFAALSDFIDERLDADSCERIRRHMDGCPACLAFLEELRRTAERCRSAQSECSPQALAAVQRLLLDEYKRLPLRAASSEAAEPLASLAPQSFPK